jgi:hypothetical protein
LWVPGELDNRTQLGTTHLGNDSTDQPGPAARRSRSRYLYAYLGIHETVEDMRGDRPISPEPVTIRPQSQPRLAALGMAFTDVAFLHWPYPPDQVGPLLPPAVVDTFSGMAYVGLVAFRMRCYGEFLEFNVRT